MAAPPSAGRTNDAPANDPFARPAEGGSISGSARRVVVAGGSGLVGRALVASLVRDGIRVTILSRSPTRRRPDSPAGVEVIGWRPNDPGSAVALGRALAGAAAVVNLSGLPIGPLPWWLPGRRRAITASRVGTSHHLVAAMTTLDAAERPRALVNAAGTDAYVDLDAEPATEDTDVSGTTGFLPALSRDWEAAAAAAGDLGVRVVMIQTAIVFGRGANLVGILALPVRLFLGGRFGSGTQWFSWIHLDDLVAVYRRAIDDPGLSGPVIAAAPQPSRQIDVARAMGRVLHRPTWFPAPAWLLRLVLGEQATLLLGSRRVEPARLRASGFEFRFPDLDAALADVLGPAHLGRDADG